MCWEAGVRNKGHAAPDDPSTVAGWSSLRHPSCRHHGTAAPRTNPLTILSALLYLRLFVRAARALYLHTACFSTCRIPFRSFSFTLPSLQCAGFQTLALSVSPVFKLCAFFLGLSLCGVPCQPAPVFLFFFFFSFSLTQSVGVVSPLSAHCYL